MDILTVYDEFVKGRCEEVSLDNACLKLRELAGIDLLENMMENSIVDSIKELVEETFMEELTLENLADFGALALDVAAAAIPGVSKFQAKAYNLINSAIAAQPLVSYASAIKAAEALIKLCKANIKALQAYQAEAAKLNNELAKVGKNRSVKKEYKAYAVELKNAHQLVVNAQKRLSVVRSTYAPANGKFLGKEFSDAKSDLEKADAILIPKGKPSATLNKMAKNIENYVGDVRSGTEAMIMNRVDAISSLSGIPGLAVNVVAKYKDLMLKAIEFNKRLDLFCGIKVDTLLGANFQKKPTLATLDSAIKQLKTVTTDMATHLNKEESIVLTTRGPMWGLQVKAVRALLKTIDPKSLEERAKYSVAAQSLGAAHSKAVAAFAKLNTVRGQHCTANFKQAREPIGDLEKLILQLSAQSMTCISEMGIEDLRNENFSPEKSNKAAKSVVERVGLSIKNYQAVIAILEAFIKEAKKAMAEVAAKNAVGAAIGTALGAAGLIKGAGELEPLALLDAVMDAADAMGFDRLAEKLGMGDLAALATMTAKTASTIGATVIALNTLWGMAQDTECQRHVADIATRMKAQETQKMRESERKGSKSVAEQMKQNEKICAKLKKDNEGLKKKLPVCLPEFELPDITDALDEAAGLLATKLGGGDGASRAGTLASNFI